MNVVNDFARRPLVVANWKMNGSLAFVSEWVSRFTGHPRVAEIDTVVCPPHLYLAPLHTGLAASGVELGAQDLNENDEGAFTGEVSGRMLGDCNCRYVIVGHSERRRLLMEDDERTARKMQAAMRCGLVPILCVGETLEQRTAGATRKLLERQLAAVSGVLDRGEFAVAYEPVWAIGSGKNATPEQAAESCDFIRSLLAGRLGDGALRTRVVYGGSVNRDNVQSLFALPDIDGGLIGGASLDADVFHFICEAAAGVAQ